MSTEAILAALYAGTLLVAALVLEWLSAHTHRRALRFRTAGFNYEPEHDRWVCPEGTDLWPHEFDQERRLMRYRAKSHICNGCPIKAACTDSDDGREIVQPVDPWPHSEAGRFHRSIAVMLVAVAALVLVVALVRNHSLADFALLLGCLTICAAVGWWLARDLARHPVSAPEPSTSHGLRVVAAGADGAVPPSRWQSLNRPAARAQNKEEV